VKAATHYRMQPMKIMSLSPQERKASPYIDKDLFEANQVRIAKLRHN